MENPSSRLLAPPCPSSPETVRAPTAQSSGGLAMHQLAMLEGLGTRPPTGGRGPISFYCRQADRRARRLPDSPPQTPAVRAARFRLLPQPVATACARRRTPALPRQSTFPWPGAGLAGRNGTRGQSVPPQFADWPILFLQNEVTLRRNRRLHGQAVMAGPPQPPTTRGWTPWREPIRAGPSRRRTQHLSPPLGADSRGGRLCGSWPGLRRPLPQPVAPGDPALPPPSEAAG